MGGTGTDVIGEMYALGMLMFSSLGNCVQVGSLEERQSFGARGRLRCSFAEPTPANLNLEERSENQNGTDKKAGNQGADFEI
jgi:hypothetical protein